jgi:hypothetical protein
MLKMTLFATTLFTALAPAALAADSTDIALGGAALLHLPGNAARVVVGNPAIADITLQSPRSLAVFGKYPGGTTLLVTDQAGKVILQTNLVVTASGADGVTIRYGTGRNWVPGGSVASAECGRGVCSPVILLPSDSVYKANSGAAAPPAAPLPPQPVNSGR